MSAKVSSWLYERRPLKRPKLGPPDIYPQESRQKEDELTGKNVKEGFSTSPLSKIEDEYGSARNSPNITPNKFASFFSALLAKKQELNTFDDVSKKKQQFNTKDGLWLVTAKSKSGVDAWFKDLTCGSKALNQLSKKFPVFNKKEEIFLQLYEFHVPMFRATWFIKMSSAYQTAITESSNKSKKRQMADPSQDWTANLCKFLRELYLKLMDGNNSTGLNSSTITASLGAGGTPTTGNVNSELIYKQWQYYIQLARYLFEEELLDKQDFLTWLVDLFEKMKTPEDNGVRILIPLLVQYSVDFTHSELLSRRLAYLCAKNINILVTDYSTSILNNSTCVSSPQNLESPASSTSNTNVNSNNNNSNATPSNASNTNVVTLTNNNPATQQLVNPLYTSFKELQQCPQHRNIVLALSSIIQVITLDCPTALVWHNVGENKGSPAFQGSPLDHLPCPPSTLPMPPRAYNSQLREDLRTSEEEIRVRSRAVEMKWSCDRWQQTVAGTTISKLLTVLEALDRHCFDRVDSTNNIDALYIRIFGGNFQLNNSVDSNKNVNEIIQSDEPTIKLLCEWAVTCKRTGEYRALVVAKLLEKRQNELTVEKEPENTEEKDVEMVSANNSPNGVQGISNNLQNQIYQNLLINFLDTQAPVLDERVNSSENIAAFSNLVLLFGELIRSDVFSHDSYMCTLISRGLFANSPSVTTLNVQQNSDTKIPSSNEPSLTGFVPSLPSSVGLQSLSGNSCHLGGPSDGQIQNRNESSLPMFDPVTDFSGHNRSDQWDADDAGLDADLDKLLQNIKEGQQNNMNDQTDILLPDSVSSDKEDEHGNGRGNNNFSSPEAVAKTLGQRHLCYTTHFPLPQDETMNHDCNQRHILLYGVSKARDDARHLVKKTTKEIMKLFNRKSSMDISEGGKVKKPAIKDGFNFEATLGRFQSLSYYDQHAVTSSCATACIEMLNGVGNASANYLPLIESIAFLFDLMEIALDVHGIIDFVLQTLKELGDVEIQLQQKCPTLSGTYCTTTGLYIVGVLYRYQPCLFVSLDETIQVFEGLYKLVKHITNPADCSSAERCILCYLFDIYTSCSNLRSKYHDQFGFLYNKIKQIIYSPQQPSASATTWDLSGTFDFINNPKVKIDVAQLKQLNDIPGYRFSFVCAAVLAVSLAREANRLNEISILCAELTARCPIISSEWLGVLKALCCTSNNQLGFTQLLNQINVSDISIHDNLAIFVSILVARRCISLHDFIFLCALPSLLAPCSTGGGQESESGARFTCHLLLFLFKSSDLSSSAPVTPATICYSLTSPGPLATPNSASQQKPMNIIKHPCDRYLLAAAHSGIIVELVLSVLKAMHVLGDSTENGKDKTKADSSKEISISDILGSVDVDVDFGDFGLPPFQGKPNSRNDGSNGEIVSLGEFAKQALKQICCQDWVHEKCLRDPEMINRPGLLVQDPMLNNEQAQQLLLMICYPKYPANHIQDTEMEQKQQIFKILQNLDEWTIRVSLLQLQLMYSQCCTPQSTGDVNSWLDNVAKATIDFFQNSSEESIKATQTSRGNSKNMNNKNSSNLKPENCGLNLENRVWLVAPLISKLPAAVQGKILKVAANVLESGNWMSCGSGSSSQSSYNSSKNKDRTFQQQKMNNNNATSSTLLSYPPFLSLVIMCLKGQDEQRESLLKSLFSQLNQAIHEPPSDDSKMKYNIQEGLQLRLSLVGGMFDMIQRLTNQTLDWALLLLQLISYGVVEPQLNYELFTSVLDMLAVLIHTTQASDSSEPETRKQYQNLIKKLKREVNAETECEGIKMARKLLPIAKQQLDVITCEPMGSLIDTKGNKIQGFDSIDKKQGLQVAMKQKVSPWDLMEGNKNPAPLCWKWFGAVRYERKPLRGEENHNLLEWHTHASLMKPTSYYLEPPPCPPEDVDPSPIPPPTSQIIDTKPMPQQMMPQLPPGIMPLPITDETMKRETLTPIESIPRGGGAKKTKAPRRKRQPRNATAAQIPPAGQQTPPIRMQSPYDNTYQAQAPQQQGWFSGPQQAPLPHQVASQQAYYHQGPPIPQQPARFERPNSKAVLNSMLRARQPGGGNQIFTQSSNPPNAAPPMPAPQGPSHPYQARSQMIIPRQMRPTQPQHQQPQMQVQQGAPMYQMHGSNQGSHMQPTQMHHMQPQQQQNYGAPPPNLSYGNTMPMQGMEQQMQVNQVHPNTQTYQQQQQQNPMMNTTMRSQMAPQQHQQPQMNQQFMSQRQQYGGMPQPVTPNVTLGQMPPNGGYGQAGQMQGMPQPHIRQQMQQMQLQRQLSSGKPQQHNPYHQQGPYQ